VEIAIVPVAISVAREVEWEIAALVEILVVFIQTVFYLEKSATLL